MRNSIYQFLKETLPNILFWFTHQANCYQLMIPTRDFNGSLKKVVVSWTILSWKFFRRAHHRTNFLFIYEIRITKWKSLIFSAKGQSFFVFWVESKRPKLGFCFLWKSQRFSISARVIMASLINILCLVVIREFWVTFHSLFCCV